DRIVGFTVDARYCTTDSFAGRPLVAWEDLERFFPPDRVKLLGPLSFRRLNDFRRDRYLEAKARGYGFTSFVHPSCHVYADQVGEHCFILENNTLQPFVSICNNVMMWSNNHIGHHAVVGDHCFLSSQVGLSSNVTLGPACFLGGKASVDYGFSIGAQSYLGPGCVVQENLPDHSVVHGVRSAVARYSSQRLKRL